MVLQYELAIFVLLCILIDILRGVVIKRVVPILPMPVFNESTEGYTTYLCTRPIKRRLRCPLNAENMTDYPEFMIPRA